MRRRLRDSIDPSLIRQVRGIAWVWTAAFLACGALVQAIAVQLPNPAWFVLPGGRSSSASVHAFVPLHLLLVSWGALLVFVVWALVSRELSRPRRVWPMVVLAVLGVVGAAFFGTLATGAILQLGHTVLGPAAAAALLVVPAESVSAAAAIAALLSLIIVPTALAVTRGAQRQRPALPSPNIRRTSGK